MVSLCIAIRPRNFPGSPVVRAPWFHCREPGFDLKFSMLCGMAPKKRRLSRHSTAWGPRVRALEL